MKRILGALLCTAWALVAFASFAHADQWVERSVKFHIARAAVATANQDSVVTTRESARTDTSVAFTVPLNRSEALSAISDSLHAFVVKWSPVDPSSDPNSITIASGTTTITVQASSDGGYTWSTLADVTAKTLTAVGTGAYNWLIKGHIGYDAYRVIMNSAATGTYSLRVGYWKE